LPARSRGGALVRYPLVNTRDALLWLVDYGCIDLHVASARCDRPELPDYVIFDLDARDGFGAVVAVALFLKDALDAMQLESVVRTSGGDGLHVLVPIARRHSYEEVRAFARVVADAVAAVRLRDTANISVDVKMNGRVQQFVTAYSVRPRPGATVATPLAWYEVDEGLDPAAFTMTSVLERVEHYGDLHAPLLRGRQRLGRALARL
jgi:bifunctional non-homologous end joining protein LigD